MNESTNAPAIPADEASFYSLTASRRVATFSRFETIDEIDPKCCDTEILRCLIKLLKSRRPFEFLEPRELWISSIYECVAEWNAYNHLAPIQGKRVLQIGGTGLSAIQFALGGAREAWLLTPLDDEARYALEIARLAGVELKCKIGVAEDIPFDSATFDAVYAGGCVHHFETTKAFPGISRILATRGRFSSVEPWKGPLYSLGIKLFGKREPVNCRPLTAERVAPGFDCFSNFSVVHHGAATRYPALAIRKVLPLSLNACWRLTRVDDALSSALGIRRYGSVVSIAAGK
ncbi:MAG TPA: class I SAM-dependent methyltransferase [Candidatus Angelobacter sp.]|nr:class I SAM-dependent methyltransferase [Candidatus Angelobacter sp.]